MVQRCPVSMMPFRVVSVRVFARVEQKAGYIAMPKLRTQSQCAPAAGVAGWGQQSCAIRRISQSRRDGQVVQVSPIIRKRSCQNISREKTIIRARKARIVFQPTP